MKKFFLNYSIRAIFISIILVSNLIADGLNKEIFVNRRQKIMDAAKDGIVIFKNSELSRRSNDVYYYPYRTNSDFYYLTGYVEPEAAFILAPHEEKKFIMFVTHQNAITSQRYGNVPGIEGAMKIYGADAAYSISDFNKTLQLYINKSKKIYYDLHDKKINDLIDPIALSSFETKERIDINQFLHEFRMIKDSEEIKEIRKAVNLTCESFKEVIKSVSTGMYEYEIEALFSYLFEKNGSNGKAFEPVIASGPNATIYHYSKLNRKIQSGDMVMMDMGAEFNNYASDITRVIPANGKFSEDQKAIYDIVLKMEETVINNMKPGAVLDNIYKLAEKIAIDELFKLGLITDPNTKWQHYLYWFPYICHSIGLDVHDVSNHNYSTTPLQPGMVFAVEPLIYVGENLIGSFKLIAKRWFSVPDKEIDSFLNEIKPKFERYKNIAARIEDDVLITVTGNEILSSQLPKSVDGLEKLMSKK